MKNYLIKFIKSGIGVGLSAIFGLLLLRSISKEQGPEGLATFGIYRQFLQFCAVFLTWGNGFSIIESFSKAKDKEHFTSNTFKYFLGITFLLGFTILLFSYPITLGLFDDNMHWDLIALAPLVFIGMSFHGFFRFIITGKQHLIMASILQAAPFIFMFFFYFFTKNLFSFFLLAYLSSAIFAFIFWKTISKEKILLTKKPSRLLDFEKTSIATIFTGAFGFLSLLLVKSISVHALGMTTTGILEAEYSMVSYLTLALISGLGTFYLGRISENPNDKAFREKIFSFLIPLTSIVLAVFIYYDQFFLNLLFGRKIVELGANLSIFGLGEMLRCINWFFTFSMIGLGFRKTYLIFDTVSYGIYVAASAIVVSLWPFKSSIEYGYLTFQVVYLMLNLYLCVKVKVINPKLAIGLTMLSSGFICLLILVKDL